MYHDDVVQQYQERVPQDEVDIVIAVDGMYREPMGFLSEMSRGPQVR